MKQLAGQKGCDEAFEDFDKAISQSRDLLKRFRHGTSGHLAEGAFGNAQAGSSPKTLHFKFCLGFLGAIVLRKVDKDFEEEWGRILKDHR